MNELNTIVLTFQYHQLLFWRHYLIRHGFSRLSTGNPYWRGRIMEV